MTDERIVRAAGITVGRPAGGDWEFLLVRSRVTGDWGCPKGHCDPGESDVETARREVLEETGVADVALLDGSREVRYPLKRGGGTKVVVYFVGTVAEGTPFDLDNDECTDGGWFALGDALDLVTHAVMREVLSWASETIARAMGAR